MSNYLMRTSVCVLLLLCLFILSDRTADKSDILAAKTPEKLIIKFKRNSINVTIFEHDVNDVNDSEIKKVLEKFHVVRFHSVFANRYDVISVTSGITKTKQTLSKFMF